MTGIKTTPTPRPAPGAHMTRAAAPALADMIRAAICEAEAAQPLILRAPADPSADWQVRRNPTPAAALRALPLAFAGAIATTTPATPAERLGAEIAARSVLVGLGLNLIACSGDQPAVGVIVGGDGQRVQMAQATAVEFSLPRPAPFALVAEDDEAAEVASLADRTRIAASGLRVNGFRAKLTRAVLKDRDPALLAAELSESIICGAARAIDRIALEALSTGDGVPVGDMRAAGAAGVSFDRLRAVIGRLGPSGEFALPDLAADRGALFFKGVQAVFTDQAAGGWIGDWSTHAVAHTPEISVLVTKTNARGDLVLSAWMGAEAVSPIAGATNLWRLA